AAPGEGARLRGRADGDGRHPLSAGYESRPEGVCGARPATGRGGDPALRAWGDGATGRRPALCSLAPSPRPPISPSPWADSLSTYRRIAVPHPPRYPDVAAE